MISGPNDWKNSSSNNTLAFYWVDSLKHNNDVPDSCCVKNSTNCGVEKASLTDGKTVWNKVPNNSEICQNILRPKKYVPQTLYKVFFSEISLNSSFLDRVVWQLCLTGLMTECSSSSSSFPSYSFYR